MFRKSSYIFLFLFFIVPDTAQGFSLDSLYETLLADFDVLPEYYTKFDMSTFAFHKNAYFKQQNLAETNTGLTFVFLSYRQFIYSVWDVRFKIGFGDIPDNVVFSVLNIHFFLIPAIELRLPSVYLAAGYEHLCVHEVDRKNYPVIHYNAPYISIRSPNMRFNQYWTPLTEENNWTFHNRIGWSFMFLDYLKDGFGIVGPNKVNGYNPYSQEIRADARYAIYKRKSWIFAVTDNFRFGHYDRTAGVVDHGGLYWREDLGIEGYFRRGKRGAAFYAKYIMDNLPSVQGLNGDELPIFSKDKLLEIGISFFN